MTAWIASTGSRAPVGLTSRQVAMCARAKKLEPRALPHLRDKRGHEIGMALCAGIPLSVEGYSRTVALATPALAEALRGYDAADDRPIPAVIAIAEEGRPDDDPRYDEQLLADLAEKTGAPIDRTSSTLLRCGHAGGAFALETALGLVDAGHPAVLVGGVDSYYGTETLAWLDEECRLHTTESYDGFIPSEGAGFFVITKAAPTAALGRVSEVLTGVEPNALDEGSVNAADTSTELMAEALRSGPLSWIISDINGERHRVREWTLIAIRHQLDVGVHHDRLVEGVGEVGAATGALALNVACARWQTKSAPARRVAIVLAAEGAERGVVVAEDGR